MRLLVSAKFIFNKKNPNGKLHITYLKDQSKIHTADCSKKFNVTNSNPLKKCENGSAFHISTKSFHCFSFYHKVWIMNSKELFIYNIKSTTDLYKKTHSISTAKNASCCNSENGWKAVKKGNVINFNTMTQKEHRKLFWRR